MDRAQATNTTVADSHGNTWESFRCRTCNKLLFKMTRQMGEGLTRDQQLEIKCQCKSLNYLMGA